MKALLTEIICLQESESYLKTQLSEENLAWADGIMLVYDVGDISTFHYAKEVINFMSKRMDYSNESSNRKLLGNFKPLLLLGNKTDLVVGFASYYFAI